MNDINQDVIFAWRNALKNPGTSLLIVITLALGIGSNTAMLSVAWQTLLAPLPYADEERLVTLQQNAGNGAKQNFGWSEPTLQDFRAQGTAFSGLVEYAQLPFPLVTGAGTYQVMSGVVGWQFFELLGVQAEAGRLFVSSDNASGAEAVMLLSHDFWVSRYGSDPNIIGTTMEMKNIIYRIVGVLPRLPPYPHANDIWIPSAVDPYRLFSLGGGTNRNSEWNSYVLGKLAAGVGMDQAQAEVNTITRRLVENYPDTYASDYAVALKSVKDDMTGSSRMIFLLLLGLASLVLLIACANIANLNLARMAARTQELAIREAMGATPVRLTQQLLAENLLYSLAGALVGFAIAIPVLKLLAGFASAYTPLASEISMDGSVFFFAITIGALTGILSGFSSCSGQRDIITILKEGSDKNTTSASSARRKQALLAIQFALAFVVLTTSALIMYSLYLLHNEDAGYESDQVLAASMMINVNFDAPWQALVPQYKTFSRTLLAQVRAIPGVESAGILAGVPLLQDAAYLGEATFGIEGRVFADSDAKPHAPYHAASEGYFELLGIPLLSGRMFTEADDENSLRVAIINETFAKRFFPAGDALGQRITLPGEPLWSTIVGVVGNVRSQGLDEVEQEAAYLNYWQYPTEVISLYLKSNLASDELANVVAATVREIDPRQTLESIRPLNEVKSTWLAPTQLRAVLIALFGILALIVTLSGVIGVVSYNVSQRVREIAVHMAIGANPTNIVTMFIKQGLKIYACGLLLGLGLMLFTAPLLQPLLYQTAAFHTGIYFVNIVLLTFAVLIAMYLPARRAAAMSPTAALHCL